MISFTPVFYTSLFLCGLFAQVGAYLIDASCRHYYDQSLRFMSVNRTDMITAAMQEAHSMMLLASSTVLDNVVGIPENSRSQLFEHASHGDQEHIAARYRETANSVKWGLIDMPHPDHINVYCGDAIFVPIPRKSPYAWINTHTGVVVEASRHEGGLNPRMCGDAVSMTLTSPLMPGVYHSTRRMKYLVLCDPALTRGNSPDATESQPTVAAVKALPGRDGFHEMKRIDNVAYATCLSFVLLRALLSLGQDKFAFDHAVNTPVGWDEVKGLPIVDAKKNVDSYAFYALSQQIMAVSIPGPIEWFVLSGYLISVSRACAIAKCLYPLFWAQLYPNVRGF